MTQTKSLSLFLIISVLIGCSAEKLPNQVYNEYNSKVMSGISYADDKAYYSKRKQQEVESKMPQYMKQMNKTRDEVIEVYLEVSRELAKCKEITLVNEVIESDTALLEYSQKDICGNDSASQEKQSIRMVNKGGWKIDDIEISL